MYKKEEKAMSFGMFLTILGAATLARGIMQVIELVDKPGGKERRR